MADMTSRKCSLLVAVIAILLAFLFSRLPSPSYPVQEGVVIITGASTGIGYDAALHLAARHPGSHILAGVRKPADFARIAALGIPNLAPLLLDVTSGASIQAAHEAVVGVLAQQSLPLLGVVNNAGMAAGPTASEFHSLADAKALFEVNFFGALQVTQAFLPLLRASRGRLVGVSSIFGTVAPPMGGVYAASKFALEALHDSLRRELTAAGVSVSLVAPGAVATPIFRTLEPASLEQATRQGTPASKVYPQFHTPRDLANEVSIERLADSTLVTSQALEHALFEPRPLPRYYVANILGAPAWVLAGLAHYLPVRLMDVVMLQK